MQETLGGQSSFIQASRVVRTIGVTALFARLWHLLDLAIAAAAATVSSNNESME
jgi:hypothetical protein